PVVPPAQTGYSLLRIGFAHSRNPSVRQTHGTASFDSSMELSTDIYIQAGTFRKNQNTWPIVPGLWAFLQPACPHHSAGGNNCRDFRCVARFLDSLRCKTGGLRSWGPGISDGPNAQE